MDNLIKKYIKYFYEQHHNYINLTCLLIFEIFTYIDYIIHRILFLLWACLWLVRFEVSILYFFWFFTKFKNIQKTTKLLANINTTLNILSDDVWRCCNRWWCFYFLLFHMCRKIILLLPFEMWFVSLFIFFQEYHD